MREAEDWDPNLRKISRGAIIYSYGWPLDIYGAYHRLSNTWLTRIIAFCLDAVQIYFSCTQKSITLWVVKVKKVLDQNTSVSTLHLSFLLCLTWKSDAAIMLASALQLFNIEFKITFPNKFRICQNWEAIAILAPFVSVSNMISQLWCHSRERETWEYCEVWLHRFWLSIAMANSRTAVWLPQMVVDLEVA